MENIKTILLTLSLLLLISFPLHAQATHSTANRAPKETIIFTPNQLYAEVERIAADLSAIMRYRHVPSVAKIHTLAIQVQPRHVWQKTYEVMAKINVFRRLDHYPAPEIGTLEPTATLHPKMVFDQTQRILTELNLIKARLNLVVSNPTPAAKQQTGKSFDNVYALLNKVSEDLDALIGSGFTPSDVFAQVMRINDDIDTILNAMNIHDDAFPPAKLHNSKPADAFRTAMELLTTVDKLQRKLLLPVTDFTSLANKRSIQPKDVFELVGLIIAELQPIKHALAMIHARTPMSEHYEGKTPTDVAQLIGWCDYRLQQTLAIQQ